MVAAIYPLYGAQKRIQLIVAASGPPITLTGTTAAGTGLTALDPLAGVAIGDVVTGTGIVATPPTTVVALDDAAHTATLSQAALGVHVGVPITFTHPAGPSGLQGATARLYQSSLTPGPGTTLATLITAEANFDGYAAKTLTMDTGYINGTSQAVAESQLLVWIPTGSVTPNNIGGIWTDDGTGAIEIWPLPAAVPLAGPSSVLKVLVTDAYPTPGAAIQVLPVPA
jgi:hypothetical protein